MCFGLQLKLGATYVNLPEMARASRALGGEWGPHIVVPMSLPEWDIQIADCTFQGHPGPRGNWSAGREVYALHGVVTTFLPEQTSMQVQVKNPKATSCFESLQQSLFESNNCNSSVCIYCKCKLGVPLVKYLE